MSQQVSRLSQLLRLQDTRKERRAVRRRRAATAARQLCRPHARSWSQVEATWAQWTSHCKSYFTAMTICAFCGHACLGRDHQTLDPAASSIGADAVPPYALSNPLMFDFMTDEAGHWYMCEHCQAAAKHNTLQSRSSSFPTMSTNYIRDLLTCTSVDLARLSTLNVAVHFSARWRGFMESTVSAYPMFQAAIATHTSADAEESVLSESGATVLAANLLVNPVVRTFKTIAESMLQATSCATGVALLPLQAIKHIWHKYMARGPITVASMASDVMATQLHAVLPIEPLSSTPGTTTNGNIHLGRLTTRNDTADVDWVLATYNAQPGAVLVHPSATTNVTTESTLMPYLFPHGRGFYQKGNTRHWFASYLKMRCQALFSPFTLCRTYLPIMTIQKHCYNLCQNTCDATLQSAVHKYNQQHPGASEEEIMAKVLKHTLPASIPGTPAYYRQNLLDLLALVRRWGMPSLFLTLTADEASDMRWAEISDLTELLHRFNASFTFADAPVECATLFLQRLDDFLKNHVFANPESGGILGRVQHHVTRLEVQGRGSLHAHIMLWIHPEDLPWVSQEIHAFVPAHFDSSTRTFVEPTDPAELMLFKLVARKQMHICTPPGAAGCREAGNCKYHFPAPQQLVHDTVFDAKSKRYLYYRPRHVDRNVVPYHPTILLLWGAHMNLQRVTNAAWSAYLLKYAMKCEPTGKLNLDKTMLKNMGFDTTMSDTQLSVATSLCLTKPCSPCEAALLLLGRPSVSFSTNVQYVDSKTPGTRILRCVGRHINTTIVHPVDKYVARPAELEDVPFCTYFTDYRLDSNIMENMEYIGMDALGNFVHARHEPAIVRFTDYHPARNIEGYCYNMLLRKVPFRHEEQLLELGDGNSYLTSCILQGYIQDEDDLLGILDDYCAAHLYATENLDVLLAQLRSTLPATAIDMLELHDCYDAAGANHDHAADAVPAPPPTTLLRPFATESWFRELNSTPPQLTPSQAAAFQSIVTTEGGLHVICGGPGTGKTFLTRYLTHYFTTRDINVRLTATTGAAAVRLSKHCSTMHSAFAIPCGAAYLTPLSSGHCSFVSLAQSDVIVVEEFSMAKAAIMDYAMLRLQSITRTSSLQQVLRKKKVVLVGDPNQLPPVCTIHARTADGVCRKCRINNSACWPLATVHKLLTNVRNADDPDLANFLQNIQDNQHLPHCGVTQAQLDNLFGQCYITPEQAMQELTPDTTVICSHHTDVTAYNTAAMARFFTAADVQPIPLHSNAHDVPELQDWLYPRDEDDDLLNDKFHRLPWIAKGAKVMLTCNYDLTIGAANGSIGTILDWSCTPKGDIAKITVHLTDLNTTIAVRRSSNKTICFNSKRYFKATFPLALAYAITGHSSQGLSLATKTIVHIRQVFAAGLAYVMVSRAATRAILQIVGRLTPDMFIPMPPL